MNGTQCREAAARLDMVQQQISRDPIPVVTSIIAHLRRGEYEWARHIRQQQNDKLSHHLLQQAMLDIFGCSICGHQGCPHCGGGKAYSLLAARREQHLPNTDK